MITVQNNDIQSINAALIQIIEQIDKLEREIEQIKKILGETK